MSCFLGMAVVSIGFMGVSSANGDDFEDIIRAQPVNVCQLKRVEANGARVYHCIEDDTNWVESSGSYECPEAYRRFWEVRVKEGIEKGCVNVSKRMTKTPEPIYRKIDCIYKKSGELCREITLFIHRGLQGNVVYVHCVHVVYRVRHAVSH